MRTAVTSLAPPAAASSVEDHADWLELVALADADRRASIEDLIGALRTTSSTEDLEDERLTDRGSELAQSVAESAMSLAEERAAAMLRPEHYPFSFSGQTVTARPSAVRTTYAFLLLLSAFGEDSGPSGTNGASLFEDVSAVAARNYLGGDRTGAQVYNFGFPRKLKPAGFKPALEDLSRQLSEGGGGKDRPSRRHQKDAKLDLVAWIPMPDRRSSKVIGFGQCATGRNWKSKVTELQAEPWCRKWFVDPPPVIPLRLFFLPYRINGTDWDDHAIDAGIIFDRCRLATYAAALDRDVRQSLNAWNAHVVREKLLR